MSDEILIMKNADDLAAGADPLRYGNGRIGRIEGKQFPRAQHFDIPGTFHDEHTDIPRLRNRIGDNENIAVMILGLHAVTTDGDPKGGAAGKRIPADMRHTECIGAEISAQTRGRGLLRNAERDAGIRLGITPGIHLGQLIEHQADKALAGRIQGAILFDILKFTGRDGGQGNGPGNAQKFIHRGMKKRRNLAKTLNVRLAFSGFVTAIGAGSDAKRLCGLILRKAGMQAGLPEMEGKIHGDHLVIGKAGRRERGWKIKISYQLIGELSSFWVDEWTN